MPTRLKNGIIHLESEYTLCNAGRPISPEQAKLLKLLSIPIENRPNPLFLLYLTSLDIKLADFHFDVVGVWSADGEKVEVFEEAESDDKEDDKDGDMEDEEEEDE